MRIVAGSRRGTKLAAPDGLEVRPSSERLREALFSMLDSGRLGVTLRDARVMDLFAGTGALGLEAISRGAALVVFVENHPAALAALRANIGKCRARELCHIRDADAARFSERAPAPATLVLMDPPYRSGLWESALESVDRGGWIDADTVVVLEIGRKDPLAVPPGFELLDDRRYGAGRIVLLRRAGTDAAETPDDPVSS